MQDISVRLANSHFCLDMPNLVEELYNAPNEQVAISFWGGVELTLPGHQGSVSLDDIIAKVEYQYKNFPFNCQRDALYRPAKNIQKILRMCASLEERVSQKLQTAYKVTKVFLWIRECLEWICFNRAYSTKRLNDVSLDLITIMSHFHLSSVSKICEGAHHKDSIGKFSATLPSELADDAVVLTTSRMPLTEPGSKTNQAPTALISKVSDGIDISGVDIIATREENFPKLQTYLISNGLAHCYTLMPLNALRKNIGRWYTTDFCTREPLTTPFPYWGQNRDYYLDSIKEN